MAFTQRAQSIYDCDACGNQEVTYNYSKPKGWVTGTIFMFSKETRCTINTEYHSCLFDLGHVIQAFSNAYNKAVEEDKNEYPS